jgi:hypothetical protein
MLQKMFFSSEKVSIGEQRNVISRTAPPLCPGPQRRVEYVVDNALLRSFKGERNKDMGTGCSWTIYARVVAAKAVDKRYGRRRFADASSG